MRLNGELTWVCNVSAIMISLICIKLKRTKFPLGAISFKCRPFFLKRLGMQECEEYVTICLPCITKYAFIILTPFNPFYIVKLGFTWIYVIFLFSAQKPRLWVFVRTASSSEYPQPTEQKFENYQNISSESFHFFFFFFWW